MSPTHRRYSTSSARADSRCSEVSTGARLSDTIRFYFHQPARVDQAADLHERARGLHAGKDLAMRARRFFPARDVREHDARTDDIFQAESGFGYGPGNDFETAPRLPVEVARRRHAAIGGDRRGARHGDDGTHPHHSGKADARFERRSGRDELSHQLRPFPSGSIPPLRIAPDARSEARNAISRFAASSSFDPATTAAAKIWLSWISSAITPASSTPGACTISLTGKRPMSASPVATMAAASVPLVVSLKRTLSAMPSRGKTSSLRKMPLVLLGTATSLAFSTTCLKASTVLTSGLAAPARTATPIGVRAKSTSVPRAIRFPAISSVRPSLERMTTSVGTPRPSCAPMVCGPVPCDEPEPVVTLIPVVRSNSGKSCSYGPEKPPDISTFNCADAASGHISSVATMTTIALRALHLHDEKAYILRSSPSNTLSARTVIATGVPPGAVRQANEQRDDCRRNSGQHERDFHARGDMPGLEVVDEQEQHNGGHRGSKRGSQIDWHEP